MAIHDMCDVGCNIRDRDYRPRIYVPSMMLKTYESGKKFRILQKWSFDSYTVDSPLMPNFV